MKIDEFYSLSADQYCVTLHFEKEKGLNEKTGKPVVSRHQTYHGSVIIALKHYLVECLSECVEPSANVQTLLDRVDEVERKIDEIRVSKSDLSGKLKNFLIWLEKSEYNVDFEWDDSIFEEFENSQKQ
jgi:hypothetical protein